MHDFLTQITDLANTLTALIWIGGGLYVSGSAIKERYWP